MKKKAKLSLLALLSLLLAAFLYDSDLTTITDSSFAVPAKPIASRERKTSKIGRSTAPPETGEEEDAAADEICDIFTGDWVFDGESRPLYREEDCEFLTGQVKCMANGRPDDRHQKWRWQPRFCELPRFDAVVLLERLRGKRLMFVGDSLHRNQWESMVCLVQSAVPPEAKSLHEEGSLSVFHVAGGYNASLEFYWAPFLVESNSDSPKLHRLIDRVVVAESILKHAVHWKGADFLIFNTYVWWMNSGKMKVLLQGSSPAPEDRWTDYEVVERVTAYQRVMETWAQWVQQNVGPNTSVFFSSVSPLHYRSSDWNNPAGIKCFNETEPILSSAALPELGVDWRLFEVALNATRSIRSAPVSFLNITVLSEYRKDAHTSVYTTRQGELLTPEQRANPAIFADCIHWCLPGLPDTWNELLYAKIMSAPPTRQ